MKKAMRGLEAARRATVYICDRTGDHRGQGLLLDLEGEGTVVLTCHHVIAPVKADDLRVRIPQPDGTLGQRVPLTYDRERSRPRKDAVVLRVDRVRLEERPLLHKLSFDKYSGSLEATVLTHMMPNNYNGMVKPSTPLPPIAVDPAGNWPDAPHRYDVRAFRLDTAGSAKRGISGGVVLCEEGVLGLVHFARKATPESTRENYVIPLTVWAEGWSVLEQIIDPLVDKTLFATAKVRRAEQLQIGADIRIAQEGYRPDIYLERENEHQARNALAQHGSVIIVGKPKSGKTRLAQHLLQGRQQSFVIIPRRVDPPLTFEASGLAGEDLIMFFDDLHETADSSSPLLWRERIADATGSSCRLICTTRDGEDWKRVKEKQSRLLETLRRDAYVFTSRVGDQGRDLEEAEGQLLAEQLGLSKEKFDERFDGTPGSLTLNLEAMRERYEHLRDNEQVSNVPMSRLLDSAKLAYEATGRSVRASILRAIAEEIRGDGRMSHDSWDALMRRTEEEGFGRFDDVGVLQIYRPYLEECVVYEPSDEEFDLLLPILLREKDAEGLLNLGVTHYFAMKDFEKAATCISKAVELQPDQPLLKWVSYYLLGMSLVSLSRDREALEAFYTSIRLELKEETTSGTWLWLVGPLTRLNERRLLEEALDRAIRMKADEPTFFYAIGDLLLGFKEYEKAKEAFDLSIEHNPIVVNPWLRKGDVLAALNEYREALDSYDRSLSIASENLDVASVWYRKAVVLTAMGEPRDALEAYDRALNLNPDDPGLWIQKGEVAMTFEEGWEEALEAFDRALSLKPDDLDFLKLKAYMLNLLSRFEELLEACDRALSLKPQYPETVKYFSLLKMSALVSLGRHSEAMEVLS